MARVFNELELSVWSLTSGETEAGAAGMHPAKG